MVERVRSGDPGGTEELYRTISKGIRFFVYRQLGSQDLEDRVHDVFLIVLEAIRNGSVREPERLMGFVLTVVRRQIAGQITRLSRNRRNQVDFESGAAQFVSNSATPEEVLISQERSEIAREVLGRMSGRDREILTRFYLQGQKPEQICLDMHLTDTQFRLAKWRAKMQFSKLGQKRIQKKPIQCIAGTLRHEAARCEWRKSQALAS
ncbi:MAG TPA: sigma-70 family RNA polymerase sigma factor [Bryobacteraceae bacterium]|nr:sigma-70 family RNA polymerase sigma factor [Bryobacteraceae bacterium]